ncbi:MAG TPA: PEP-CTERM sorting domain-containing protein [Terriglobia bacterium]|nr:PEP-CTERM sorting domain-containing protein [Terriglobia bacterium]
MKVFHVMMLGTLTLGLSAVASADSLPANDPQIKTGGPLGGSSVAPLALPTAAPAGIITPSFTIQSPSGSSPGTSPCILIQGPFMTTSPLCYFENDITTDGTADTITQLTFDALGIDPSTVTCGELFGSPFSMCGVDSIPGGTEVSFTDGSIPFHGDFTLQFNGFPSDFSFSGSATTTPEPGTMALLLAGLGSLAIRRKRS